MRLSLSWRRHWKLVAGALGVVLVLLFVLGGLRPAALSPSGGSHPRRGDIAGTVDLFDPSIVHSIEATFDPADYEAAIEALVDDGQKQDIEANVVIDGTVVPSAGIRLKGNSALFEVAAGRGTSGGAAEASPEDLPWLIEFGAFVDEQTYQGYQEVAVRPSGAGSAQTIGLNEAVSLTLIALAGEPAEGAAYVAFSVNGGEAALRLLVEAPGASFAGHEFEDEGVLYKALPGGSFDYRGDDPAAYEGSFDQVTGQDQPNLSPLIAFIRWVEESSDEEFRAGLEERVDVASFARYLALHNLLLDADDMSGPGQNYYLFYDPDAERFTVVAWDLNFAFTGDTGRGPHEGPSVEGGHLLAERSLEAPEFQALYEQAYRDLYRQLFAGAAALEALDRWAATLASVGGGLMDAATLEDEVAALRQVITARTAALASDPVVAG